jgi:hypothetical protein
MSLGFSVGDFVLLTQLAWTIVQNSRKACGEHDELTREVTSLHIVLQRLQREVEKPNSLINRTNDGRLDELQTIVRGCDRILKDIDQVLVKYNCMSEEKRRVTRLRLKVQFGNREMKDITKIRQELSTYTSAITLFLNLLTMGSQGKVEEHMEGHSEELRELRHSLNWITATLQANNGNREGSILTSYGEDGKAIWKEFRRELLKEGFSSEELRKHKAIIKDYVMELGSRGALDIPDEETSVLEVDRLLETQAGSGKEKEVEREDNPLLVSTQSSSRCSVSLSDDESSVAGPKNHTSNHDESVDETIQNLSPLTQPAAHSGSTGRTLITPQQAATFLIISEPGEAKDDDQGRQGKSTSGFLEADKTDGPILQSRHVSDSDDSDSEEEELDEPAETALDAQDLFHNDIPVKSNENDAALLPPIGKGNITPKPVSIEEVEDEDFRSGAHPNCEDIGSLTEEYNVLHLDEYSDDEFTGSSDYEDDQSYEHDSSSSELSPDDWRNIPAPLWREAGTARHPPPILTVADFGSERRRNESSTPSQRLADTGVAATSPIPRLDSPSHVAEYPGVDSHGSHTSTTGGSTLLGSQLHRKADFKIRENLHCGGEKPQLGLLQMSRELYIPQRTSWNNLASIHFLIRYGTQSVNVLLKRSMAVMGARQRPQNRILGPPVTRSPIFLRPQ